MKILNRKTTTWVWVIIIASLVACGGVWYWYSRNAEKKTQGHILLPKFVINMDKDKERYATFQKSCASSDFPSEFTRFSAVVGKDVPNPQALVTAKAWKEIETIEKNGNKTHHYQLTRGGLGCFLSHLKVMQQFVDDDGGAGDMALIMEDDNNFLPDSYRRMQTSIQQVPADWDVLLGVYYRAEGTDVVGNCRDVTGFWGTGGYLVTKSGAEKLIREVKERKMDAQIDAFLSRMAQQDRIQIYAAKDQWFRVEDQGSTIQTHLKEIPGQDPFEFDGFRV